MTDLGKMYKKSIAVILPVYKNDLVEYLYKAIESVVIQTYNSYHIYIGVDGSIGDDLKQYLKESLNLYAKTESIMKDMFLTKQSKIQISWQRNLSSFQKYVSKAL